MSAQEKKKSQEGSDPLVGKKIGNVCLTKKLGFGGAGTVYAAKHVFVERFFAVKILHVGNNKELLQRFFREAKALASLQHDNIVHFYDFGELDDGGFYLVMEKLNGVSLFEQFLSYREHKKLHTINEIRAIIPELCAALAYIHEKGVIHRDLKPSNIFLHKTDKGEQKLKLLDFGIVSLVEEASTLTGVGNYIGTSGYVSPEQAKGAVDIDWRSDLYAVGVILFRLLTGALPFRGNSPYDTIKHHIHTPPPKLSRIAPYREWAPELEHFVDRCLAKNKEERPLDASELTEECLRVLSAQEYLEHSVLSGGVSSDALQSFSDGALDDSRPTTRIPGVKEMVSAVGGGQRAPDPTGFDDSIQTEVFKKEELFHFKQQADTAFQSAKTELEVEAIPPEMLQEALGLREKQDTTTQPGLSGELGEAPYVDLKTTDDLSQFVPELSPKTEEINRPMEKEEEDSNPSTLVSTPDLDDLMDSRRQDHLETNTKNSTESTESQGEISQPFAETFKERPVPVAPESKPELKDVTVPTEPVEPKSRKKRPTMLARQRRSRVWLVVTLLIFTGIASVVTYLIYTVGTR